MLSAFSVTSASVSDVSDCSILSVGGKQSNEEHVTSKISSRKIKDYEQATITALLKYRTCSHSDGCIDLAYDVP